MYIPVFASTTEFMATGTSETERATYIEFFRISEDHVQVATWYFRRSIFLLDREVQFNLRAIRFRHRL